jgi:hypothetical protein
MENSSNNKIQYKSSPWYQGLLLLFVFCGIASNVQAQNYFNRTYTLQATAATLDAVCSHGSLGGCMAAATVIDSSTGKQAIRIARFDAMGNLQASNYFNIPDDTDRTVYVNYKAMTRVHDNCYAMVGTVLHTGIAQYGFTLLADSNGSVYKYVDLTYRDSINLVSDVKYDGYGHLVIGGHFINKAFDSSYGLLYKFDTALNLIWLKQYHPSSILVGPLFYNLIVDDSGYVISGGSQNTGLSDFKGFKSQALMIKTDTAGVEQWAWASPTTYYTDYNNYITTALHTLDGGYLFTTMGRTYNKLLPSDPGIQLKAKQIIVKLDAARNKQWEVVVDDYFLRFNYQRNTLLELKDSSFVFLGSRTTDSLDPDHQDGIFALQHYSNKGVLLTQRDINKHLPRNIDDTHKGSGGPIYDICQTADKGFVLCGYYENKTVGAPAPSQRGWLLKLDSNGCLGVDDSQCIPSRIPIQGAAKAGITVYPNPSTGNIVIARNEAISTKQSEATLYDLLGRIVHRQALSFSNNEASIRLNLPAATYILELQDSVGNAQRERIVIQ